jgi:hypothetical protein
MLKQECGEAWVVLWKVSFIMSHYFPKAKRINDENKNGVHLKIDDFNFGHIRESNRKIMRSLKNSTSFLLSINDIK